MTIEKAWKLFATIAGAALMLATGYRSYLNTIMFPVPLQETYIKEIILILGSVIMIIIAIKKEAYWGNIMSAAALVFAIYNTVLIRIFYKFVEPYVNYIVSQPSFYPYTTESAITNYKYFMLSVSIILVVLWLRYTVIIKHNMME